MDQKTEKEIIADIETLDLEIRLTVAVNIFDCHTCANYYLHNKDRLLPEIVKAAYREGVDPVDKFQQFRKGVHARHGS